MINLPDELIEKINNPIQLPSNNGDPRLYVTLTHSMEHVEGSENLDNWELMNTGGASFSNSYEDGVNSLSVTPGLGRERYVYEIEGLAGQTYTCTYSLCSPSGFRYNGNYTPDNTIAEYSYIATNKYDMNNFQDLDHTNPWNNSESLIYSFFRMSYTCEEAQTIYFVIPFENVLDGVSATFSIMGLTIYSSTAYDVTDRIMGGTLSTTNDNKIASLNLSITNLASYDFAQEALPFHPGSEILVQTRFGNSGELIDLACIIIDEVEWTQGEKTLAISGRNHLSRLKETYCGTLESLTGHSHEVLSELLEHAGITNYDLTIGNYEWTYNFKPTDTVERAIAQLYVMFPGFDTLETPGGKVVIGYWPIRNQHLPVGVYRFNVDDDIFTRSIRQCADQVYAKVWATGRDQNGVDLEPVVVPIQNWESWVVNPNKYYFIDSSTAITQEELETWAEDTANELKYVGITEDYEGPFRPQITVGDVAQLIRGETAVKLGIITSITHHFSMENGFSTDFTVDSGGVYTSLGGNTRSKALSGYNRKQTIADIVEAAAEKVVERTVDKITYAVTAYEEPTSSGGSNLPKERARNTIFFDIEDDS